MLKIRHRFLGCGSCLEFLQDWPHLAGGLQPRSSRPLHSCSGMTVVLRDCAFHGERGARDSLGANAGGGTRSSRLLVLPLIAGAAPAVFLGCLRLMLVTLFRGDAV